MRVRITLDVEVTDEAALLAYAEERVRAAWEERLSTFAPDTPHAVYEALIGSSPGPPVATFGLELVDSHTEEIAL